MALTGPPTMAPPGAAPVWVHDHQHAWLTAALVTLLLVLMTLPEGYDTGALATPGAPSAGSTTSRLAWLMLLAGAAAVLVRRVRLLPALLRQLNPWLVALSLLALVSLAWSIDPGLTLRRLVRLATVLGVCLAFVLMHWHARRVQNVLRPALTLMLLASLLFGLLAPELAIHQESSPELAGAWRGLTSHKNSLGAMASITLILWCHAGLMRQASWTRCLAGAALATICLLLSRSSTSLATSLFALAFMLVALRAPRAVRLRLPLLVVLLLLLLALYGLAMQNVLPGLATLMAPITALSSKDVTLTGRTQIWAVMLEHIARHPLLGTGFGAYWTAEAVPGTDAHEFIARMRGFFPGSAHNGYLDVTNDLGLLGLAGLLGYIAVQARQCLALLRSDAGQATLYLALLFQQVITNLSETHWFSVLSLDFLLTTLTTTALARALLERRLLHAYGTPVRPGEA